MPSRRRLRFGAIGAFLGFSAYKRLEIENQYISPGNVLGGYYSKMQTTGASKIFESMPANLQQARLNPEIILKTLRSDILTPANLGLENYLLVMLFLLVNFSKWIIFGRLSPSEVKTLRDKITYTVWEFWVGFIVFYCNCFEFDYSIIRNELFKFGGLFLCFSLLKGFHYLAEARGNSIFANSSRTNHSAFYNSESRSIRHTHSQVKYMGIRFATGLVLLHLIDFLLTCKFFHEVIQRYDGNWGWSRNPSYKAFFASYFAQANSSLPIPHSAIFIEDNILLAIFGFEVLYNAPLIFMTSIRFTVNFYEYLRYAGFPSDDDDNDDSDDDAESYDRGIWNDTKLKIIYTSEFLVNLLRFFMICLFSIIFIYVYTFPFHILPSSYLSFRMLVEKARCLVNFKKRQFVLQKLDTPDLSSPEPDRCVICYGSMINAREWRKLPHCNHSFHFNCLKNWLEYSQSCPICREEM